MPCFANWKLSILFAVSTLCPALAFLDGLSNVWKPPHGAYHMQSEGRIEESACSIEHKPLKRIFNSEREYLFTTQRNIRDYEWTAEDEVEDLFESLLWLEDPQSFDVELHQITLVRTRLPKNETNKIGDHLCDIYDGQQRIVTLCLLIAAIRDSLGGGHEYAEEISKSIFPTKPGKADVARISIRGNGAEILQLILSKRDEFGKEIGRADFLPKVNSRKVKLSRPDKLLIGNYNHLKKRVKELDNERIIKLWDNLQNRVFVFICVPINSQTARSLVLGAMKGKDVEPIDEFKALVCFKHIHREDIQDKTLGRWNDLEAEVGRNTLESACIVFAQIVLKRALTGKGVGRVNLMEGFLRDYRERHPAMDGKHFFDEKIVKFARIMKCFRNGELHFETDGQKHSASLNFLTKAAKIKAHGGEQIEMLTLFFLTVSPMDDTGLVIGNVFLSRLGQLERLALWMLIAANKQMRLHRCFQIFIEPIDQKSGPFAQFPQRHSSGNGPLDLTKLEKEDMLTKLNEMPLATSKANVAKVILERLNEYETNRKSQGRYETFQGKLDLEHVLPKKYAAEDDWKTKWDKDAAEEWMDRLGNLALLNQSVNRSISNAPFVDKKVFLDDSPYPLTRRIAKYQRWDRNELEANHRYLLGVIKKYWSL